MRKTAYITGGSKGIGLAIAHILADNNYNVAISGRNKEALDEAESSLTKKGQSEGAILTIQSDVRNYSDEEEATQAIINHFGSIDVCICNAGVGVFKPVHELELEEWNSIIDTNLTGVFHTVRATSQSIIRSQGYYITIASLAGTNFFANGSAYNASKFGLVGFSQAMMLDLRPLGVKVSTIMPGSVSTYFNNHTPNDSDAWKIQPEDIAEMVLDLLNMNPRTLPSKIEVRPSFPHKKQS